VSDVVPILRVRDAEFAAALGQHPREMPRSMRELELSDPGGNRLRIGTPLDE
jgi:hypothetical protein